MGRTTKAGPPLPPGTRVQIKNGVKHKDTVGEVIVDGLGQAVG
jgi:hypothetical protein